MAKIVYGVDKDIRIAPENTTTLPAQIQGAGGATIKAGSLLEGNLDDRDTGFTVGANTPVAVLLHDVTIPQGGNATNGTIIIEGTVDLLKMDNEIAQAVTAGAKTALAGRIYFVKGAK